jgi:hypothetical protein
LKGIVGAVELVAEGEMPRGKTSPAQGPKFDTSKLTPGVYSAVVRAPDGALVTSRPFEVLAADAQPFVTVDKAEYRQAESLQVSFGNSTACRWDWVAVYGEGESPSTTPDNYWVYDYASNGHSTGTLVPRAAGTLTLPCADLEPGTYRAWLITNEYDALAQSAVFKVE